MRQIFYIALYVACGARRYIDQQTGVFVVNFILLYRNKCKLNSNLKNVEYFCEEKDALDCTVIRAQVFELPVDYSNQLSYTGVRHLLLLTGRPLQIA